MLGGNGRRKMYLTAKRVDRLKKKPGRYLDERGLYLQVNAPGQASWILRYERGNVEHMLGLGSTADFTLKEARERARSARQLLADGIDPIAARKTEKAKRAADAARSMTFKECAQKYFDDNSEQWRNVKHRAQFLSTLEMYAYPVIGNIAVADIDVGLVLRVLEPIWKTKTETASRLRGRIEKVLGWATVRGLRTGDNPARWSGFLSTQLTGRGKLQPVRHHAAMKYEEVPRFMSELRQRSAVAARALEFLILTATRTGAVITATWDEIDLKERVWTVPHDRAGTKIGGNEPRRVPLSDRAIELLKALPREQNNPYIFIGASTGKPLSSMAMLTLMERMGRDETAHGFRSSFKNWASERTSYPNFVSEAALFHVVADKTEAAYRRTDLFQKRIRMMADWAKFCSSTVKAGEVVPLRRVK
jgi:integrase